MALIGCAIGASTFSVFSTSFIGAVMVSLIIKGSSLTIGGTMTGGIGGTTFSWTSLTASVNGVVVGLVFGVWLKLTFLR